MNFKISLSFQLHEPRHPEISSVFMLSELKHSFNFVHLCASWWNPNSRFLMPCELKSAQDPSLFVCTSNISNVQLLCALATSHLQHFSLSGTPILWLRENGTICPFGVFPCVEAIFVQFEANPVMRPIMVLFVFPLFCRHFGCWWVLPQLTVCPFRHPYGPFYTPKTRFKGEMSNWREKYYKTWKKQKDKWFHFHACTSQNTCLFQRFCAPGTHTT